MTPAVAAAGETRTGEEEEVEAAAAAIVIDAIVIAVVVTIAETSNVGEVDRERVDGGDPGVARTTAKRKIPVKAPHATAAAREIHKLTPSGLLLRY